MATHERACNEPVAYRTARLSAIVVVLIVFAAVGCAKGRERSTSSQSGAVAANVAPAAAACACGQYSPLFCDSLAKTCANDPSDPDCGDREAACACVPPDERGVCN